MAHRNQSSASHVVLVGCDGSSEASDAVALGASLATLCRAGLMLAGIYSHPLIPFPKSWGDAVRNRETEAVLRHERDTRASSASSARVGRTQPGPHARQLLHNTPGAAAVAPRGYCERPPAPLRIAVGYGAGDEAQVALRMAAELPRQSGARLRIREVVDDRVPLGLNIAMHAVAGRSMHEARRERLSIGDTGEKVLDGAVCPEHLVPRPEASAAVGSSRTKANQRRSRRTEVVL